MLVLTATAGASTGRLATSKPSGSGRLALGATSVARVTVINRGATRSGRTALTFLLRSSGVLNSVVGKASVKPLGPRGTTRIQVRINVNPDLVAGKFKLVACLGRGTSRCGPALAVTLFSDSAFERIAKALAGGHISATQALIYKVQALVSDSRLPPAYRGFTPVAPDASVLEQALAALPSMSPSQRRIVGPYFAPPRFKQSFWNRPAARKAQSAASPSPVDEFDYGKFGCEQLTYLTGAWRGVTSSKHVVVWYRPGDSAGRAEARRVAGWVDRDIWPKLVPAFKQPMGDAASKCDPVGDDRPDIYVMGTVSQGARPVDALTFPLGKGDNCTAKSAWMEVRSGSPRTDVAHEFMHMIQFSYPGALTSCRGTSWMQEGMATWAEPFVYPGSTGHHKKSDTIPFSFLGLPSEVKTYDTWPFWYWLAQRRGTGALKRVLEGLATQSFATSLEQAPSDGLDSAFRDYAVHVWNQSPPIGQPGFPGKSFAGWDGLALKPSTLTATIGSPSTIKVSTLSLKPLSVDFTAVDVTGQSIRSLTLTNALAGKPHGSLLVFLRLASGGWRLQDLTNQPELRLCRDKPNENVTRIVLASVNTAAEGGALGPVEHQLKGGSPCNAPIYTGTFSGSASYDATLVGAGNTLTANWSGTLNLSPYAPTPPKVNYDVLSGSLEYTFSGRVNNCDVAGQTIVMLPTLDMYQANAMTISPGVPNTYQLTVALPMLQQAAGTESNCADPSQNGETFTWALGAGQPAMVASSDPATGFHPIPVGPGGVLAGSAMGGGRGGNPSQTWTWRLTPS